jgi:hypothetical protein
MNAEFVARMEQILHLYNLPYQADYPVLCIDERPCFLIGDRVDPLPMQHGRVAKEHYAYEKNGSCTLFAAIEPLQAERFVQVYARRTKNEYALFMKHLASFYPQARKIRIVQDNLNTHSTAAFYATFSAEEAFQLAQRFEFYYTPKSASWLNMIEIEFSALARQCLRRRIPTQDQLAFQILKLVKERNHKKIGINWQFTIAAARSTLNRHYQKLIPEYTQPIET